MEWRWFSFSFTIFRTIKFILCNSSYLMAKCIKYNRDSDLKLQIPTECLQERGIKTFEEHNLTSLLLENMNLRKDALEFISIFKHLFKVRKKNRYRGIVMKIKPISRFF